MISGMMYCASIMTRRSINSRLCLVSLHKTIPLLIVLICAVLNPRPASSAQPSEVSTNQVAVTNAPPVTEQEIKDALARMRKVAKNDRGEGTWLLVEIANLAGDYTTNVTYEWRGPGGQTLLREEIAERSGEKKAVCVRHLDLNNQDGYWAVWNDVAIHYPDLPNGKRKPSPQGPAEEDDSSSGGDDESMKFDLYDPQKSKVSGAHMREGERARLLIVTVPEEKTRRDMETEIKKHIPFLLRAVITTSKIKEMLEIVFPARVETLVDEETGAFVSRRSFAKDGSLIMEERGWGRCDDLSPDMYAVPKTAVRTYPKTAKEAHELETKAREKAEKTLKR